MYYSSLVQAKTYRGVHVIQMQNREKDKKKTQPNRFGQSVNWFLFFIIFNQLAVCLYVDRSFSTVYLLSMTALNTAHTFDCIGLCKIMHTFM